MAGGGVLLSRGSLQRECPLWLLFFLPYPNGLPSGYPHQFYGKETAERAVSAADKIFAAVTDYYRAKGEIDILTEADTE